MSVTTYLSTSPQIQSICIWLSWTTLNSEEVTLLSFRCDWGVHLPLAIMNNIEQWRHHCCLSDVTRGYIISFTWVKLTFPYIFILLDFSLYFPISWLFRMGSHWSHWTVKSSLCALVVLTGGVYHQFYPGKTDFSLYFPISWLFLIFSYYLTFPYIFLLVDCFEWALIGHIEQWRVHSVL